MEPDTIPPSGMSSQAFVSLMHGLARTSPCRVESFFSEGCMATYTQTKTERRREKWDHCSFRHWQNGRCIATRMHRPSIDGGNPSSFPLTVFCEAELHNLCNTYWYTQQRSSIFFYKRTTKQAWTTREGGSNLLATENGGGSGSRGLMTSFAQRL